MAAFSMQCMLCVADRLIGLLSSNCTCVASMHLLLYVTGAKYVAAAGTNMAASLTCRPYKSAAWIVHRAAAQHDSLCKVMLGYSLLLL